MSTTCDRLASFFDRCARDGVMLEFEPDELAVARALPRAWGIQPGQLVCEPGCGAGRLTVLLAEAVGPEGEVLAFDLSEEMLARARARGLPNHVRVQRGQVEHIDASAGRFHHVICFNAFPHFEDKLFALREMARVLAPGGSLRIHHLGSREQINAIHAGADDVIRGHLIPEAAAMSALVVSAGFSLVSLHEDSHRYALHAIKPLQ